MLHSVKCPCCGSWKDDILPDSEWDYFQLWMFCWHLGNQYKMLRKTLELHEAKTAKGDAELRHWFLAMQDRCEKALEMLPPKE